MFTSVEYRFPPARSLTSCIGYEPTPLKDGRAQASTFTLAGKRRDQANKLALT
jgi:hypothetical protein